MMEGKTRFAAAAVAVVALFATAAQAVDPAVKCEFKKLKEAGKYGFCRLKAESKGVKRGQAPDFSTCQAKFTQKFNQAETQAGPGVCPSEGDEPDINTLITQHTADIAQRIAGGPPLTSCGNDAIDGNEQCDGRDFGGADCTTFGFAGGTLGCAFCMFDFSGCACAGGQFPASGQTTPFGPGSDGDVQAGAPLAYVDNGDGTITDLNTGLMWEKKDDSGGIHDKDNTYTWCADANSDFACDNGTNEMDGTIVTVFLDTLNDVAGGGANCFAGHCDWRIPNIKELQSIVDYEVLTPAVDPAFHQSATCTGCSDVTLASCSCTASSLYWSSTTITGVDFPNGTAGWLLDFGFGFVSVSVKTNFLHVRAVRGGL